MILALFACAVNASSSPEGAPQPAPAPTTAAPTTAAPSAPAAAVGATAPAFTLDDTDGGRFDLAATRGKTVVLEWFNPDCPFVKYAHGPGGPLVTLPGRYIEQGVTWVAINSGAPGKQGHGQARNAAARTEYGMGYPVLLDETGAVGRLYGAKTTPHLFVIDTAGTLVFAGGLDDAPMGKGGAGQAWADLALRSVLAGSPVAMPTPKPYGCSVKYG